jgi:hypothetical protein
VGIEDARTVDDEFLTAFVTSYEAARVADPTLRPTVVEAGLALKWGRVKDPVLAAEIAAGAQRRVRELMAEGPPPQEVVAKVAALIGPIRIAPKDPAVEERIRRVVASAPPPTAEQIAYFRRRLTPGPSSTDPEPARGMPTRRPRRAPAAE